MGFDSQDNWHRKTDVKASLIKDYDQNGLRVVASASSKDGYWFVLETKESFKRFIEFALIEKSRDGRFYLKTIPESMGPYYFDCPLKFLDMVAPVPVSQSGFDWRGRVRTWHESRPAPAATRTITVRPSLFAVLGLEGR